MNPTFQCENITHRYGRHVVLHDVSLAIPTNQCICIVGASGAGKTTLLRLLAGFETVTNGRLMCNQTLLSGDGVHVPPQQRRVGFVFQDLALFPHLTVAENITFGLAQLPKTERTQIVQQWLTRMGLSDHARKYPHQLSGGQQQRVALARALAPNPSILLLDEPFAALDQALRLDMLQMLRDLRQERPLTTVLVTHDKTDTLMLADQVVTMQDGRINDITNVACGPSQTGKIVPMVRNTNAAA